jgi:hypothetical protein
MVKTWKIGAATGALLAVAIACTPRVQLEAPREPIVINLNVKVEQEIRVRVDRDLDALIAEDEDLFGTGEKP